jgi:hypothetical protein
MLRHSKCKWGSSEHRVHRHDVAETDLQMALMWRVLGSLDLYATEADVLQ